MKIRIAKTFAGRPTTDGYEIEIPDGEILGLLGKIADASAKKAVEIARKMEEELG